MMFEELANVVHAVQNEQTETNLLSEYFKKNINYANEIVAICCVSPRSSIKPHHVLSMLKESYGLFPEEYDALLNEHELPVLLADESPTEADKKLTLKEVIELKHLILSGQVHADLVFKSLSKLSAMLFWGFCFGKRSLGYRRIMRGVSKNTKYDTKHLQMMRSIMPTSEVIERAYTNTLPQEYAVQPAYPFQAPTYNRWRRWSLPFKNTHYDIVKRRYFAHRLAGAVHYYDRNARRCARDALIEGDYDCVCEIDEVGNIVEWLYTEENPNLWKESRDKRAPNFKVLKDKAHFRAVVESLNEGESLRLIDGDRPYFHSGVVGGFIVPRRTFDLPLLILGGFRDSEGIRIKIAGLDGFDIFPLGYAFVHRDNIPDRLAYMYESQTMKEETRGLIGIFHGLNYDHDTKTLKAPYLTKIDTTLGQSDAIQIGDLMER
jgi:hypothetical protein